MQQEKVVVYASRQLTNYEKKKIYPTHDLRIGHYGGCIEYVEGLSVRCTL